MASLERLTKSQKFWFKFEFEFKFKLDLLER